MSFALKLRRANLRCFDLNVSRTLGMYMHPLDPPPGCPCDVAPTVERREGEGHISACNEAGPLVGRHKVRIDLFRRYLALALAAVVCLPPFQRVIVRSFRVQIALESTKLDTHSPLLLTTGTTAA